MTDYISKQVIINKPDFLIYQSLCSFENFTPILKDKVENWEACEDKCSFRAKGFTLKLKMVDRELNKTIKIGGDEVPFEFYFWIQLVKVDDNDTRMKITIRAELNSMMKMMIGKKLQKSVDEIADQIANSFNSF